MSSSEDEYIRTENIQTRSGRISVTRAQSSSSNTPVKMATIPFANSAGSAVADQTQLVRDLASVLPKTNTIIAGSDIPTYRGRKRPSDPIFCENKNFRTHVKNLRSYISLLSDVNDDKQKKDLLVRSADKTTGDFNANVAGLVDDDLNYTFEEVIALLEDIYVTKTNKSLHALIDDLSALCVAENELLPSLLLDAFAKIKTVTDTIVNGSQIAMANHPFIVSNPNKDDAQAFLGHVLNVSLAVAFLTPLFCEEFAAKLFSFQFSSTEHFLKHLIKTVRNYPSNKRILAVPKRNQPSVETFHADSPRSELSEVHLAAPKYTGSRTPLRGSVPRPLVHNVPRFQNNFQSQSQNPSHPSSLSSTAAKPIPSCFNCQRPGHFSRDCKAPRNVRSFNGNIHSRFQRGNTTFQRGNAGFQRSNRGNYANRGSNFESHYAELPSLEEVNAEYEYVNAESNFQSQM